MNVTSWSAVPTFGYVDGVVKVKDPGVLALPPVRLLSANVCRKMIPLAMGGAVIVGVALAIVKSTLLLPL